MFLIDWIRRLWEQIRSLWKTLLRQLLYYEEEEEIVPCNYEVPNKIIGGYFWAGCPRWNYPSVHLNAGLLTHLYYAFLELEEDGTLQLQSTKAQNKDIHQELTRLRQQNPNLKLLFSVTSKKNIFSIVAADVEKRDNFVQSAFYFLNKYEYNGFDLDWEFPKARDKENFILLLRELNTAFRPLDIILTAAVRAIPIYDDSGYDVYEMVKYLDIFNIMTYDFYGAWSEHTGFNAPLYPSSQDSAYEKKYLNVEAAVNNWIKAGVPKEKICIGLPFYGRTFTLSEAEEHGVHAASMGGGKPLALTYDQIIQGYAHWQKEWDDEQKVPYRHNLDQWVGYDDERSLHEKVKFALERDLAGVFVWQLGGDDITGETSQGIKQYLLTNIYQQIIEAQHPPEDRDSEKSSELSLEHVPAPVPDDPKNGKHLVSDPVSVEDVE